MSALVVLRKEGKAVQTGGLGVVFKLFGADTGGQFAVVEHPLAPGTLGGPPHVHHKEDEASYVLEGEIMAQVGEQVIQAPVGMLIFKPNGLLLLNRRRRRTTAPGPRPPRGSLRGIVGWHNCNKDGSQQK